jgi:hypothetical protein
MTTFTNIQNAISFVEHSIKPHFIILAENNKYIVASFRDAQKLVKLGYQIIQL